MIMINAMSADIYAEVNIYIIISSYIIIYHHISYIIIHHHISYIIYHHTSSYIIYHHIYIIIKVVPAGSEKYRAVQLGVPSVLAQVDLTSDFPLNWFTFDLNLFTYDLHLHIFFQFNTVYKDEQGEVVDTRFLFYTRLPVST